MANNDIENVMLSVKEIMKMTGMGRDACYELMKSGEFHVVKIGKTHLVHKDVFERWLKGEKPPRNRF